MKKFRAVLLLTCVLCIMSLGAMAQEDTISVFVNGEQLSFDVEPVIFEGRTLVPMRTIFEALGAEVSWDADTSTAFASKGDTMVSLQIGNNVMFKNSEEIILDVSAALVNSRTMVPVRAVSEAFDCNVQWDADSRAVIITASAAEPLLRFSEKDILALKGCLQNIRYNFEQSALPSNFLSEDNPSAEICADIVAQNDYIKEYIDYIWYSLAEGYAVQIAIQSDTEYVFDNFSEEDVYAVFEQAVVDAELAPKEIYEITFETTKDGNSVALVTFFDMNSYLPCKYLAITACKDNTLRYFTAEGDMFMVEEGYDGYFFCEVIGTGRKNYGMIRGGKDAFLDAIDSI